MSSLVQLLNDNRYNRKGKYVVVYFHKSPAETKKKKKKKTLTSTKFCLVFMLCFVINKARNKISE